jgi:alpha-L-arabinofuranosidase
MTAHLRFDARPAGRSVSSTLFGLFLEDINFACDGGLNANQVNNHSFGGVFSEPRGFDAFVDPRAAARVVDRLRHWTIEGGTLASSDDQPLVPGGWFARVHAEGRAVLCNPGYPGGRPGIALRAGVPMRWSAALRPQGFTGEIIVELVDEGGAIVAGRQLEQLHDGWQHVEVLLDVPMSTSGSLRIVCAGEGVVDVDEVSLFAADHWGAGDPRWSQGLLRRDLVEVLHDLHPTFLRFPGGCIVEGHGDGNQYDWKRTVGPLESRRPDYNLWGDLVEHGNYSQSFQVGFYEYFLLCEDLGVAPMPIVYAGLACQFRVDEVVDVGGDEFDQVVQDVVDLVDWATGDPETNAWAALRAAAGHPEPFALEYLGIGNENFGPGYFERFDRIARAVDAHRPGLTFVLSAGASPDGDDFDTAWDHARAHDQRVIVDEHFYNPPEWVLGQVTRYDDYPRGGPKVFLGEYAAHFPILVGVIDDESAPANTFETALAEAAFLTGVERNADVVAMTSYAPLFNRVDASQWGHNLIDFDATFVSRTANFHVQQMFAWSTGERIVDAEGDVPEGVFVSSTATDELQWVKVVNTGHEDFEIDIELPAALGVEARTTTLAGADGARNVLTVDGELRTEIAPTTSATPIVDRRVVTTVPARSLTVFAVDVAVVPGR